MGTSVALVQGWVRRTVAGRTKAQREARAKGLRDGTLVRRGLRAWLVYAALRRRSAGRKAAADTFMLRQRLRRWARAAAAAAREQCQGRR